PPPSSPFPYTTLFRSAKGGTTCVHPTLNSHDSTQSASAQSQYAARHNPFVYFHSLIDGPSCNRYDVDLSQLPSDITQAGTTPALDRKSTRLNSSHLVI